MLNEYILFSDNNKKMIINLQHSFKSFTFHP